MAHAIEALGAIAPIRPTRTLNESSQLAALRTARTCYDHLARLGVAVFAALVAHDALQELTISSVPARRTRSGLGSVRLGQRAELVMDQFGIDVRDPPGAAACLDWTESRPHLSGPLGAALCTRMLEQGWVLHRPNTRAVRVTDADAQAYGRCSTWTWTETWRGRPAAEALAGLNASPRKRARPSTESTAESSKRKSRYA